MRSGFTLIEIIIVIVIVGVLAAVGITQYSLVVEQGRLGEAKTRIGNMYQLAQEYYFKNGTYTGITNDDVDASAGCTSSGFYYYYTDVNVNRLNLLARRCTTGGKTPDASRAYIYYLRIIQGTNVLSWNCYYPDDNSGCFGLPPS